MWTARPKVILGATPANVHDSMCLPDVLSLLWECTRPFYCLIFINTIKKIKTDLRGIKGEQAQAVFYAGRTPSLASASSAGAPGLYILNRWGTKRSSFDLLRSWTAEHEPLRPCSKAGARWARGHCSFILRVWITSPLCLDVSMRRLSLFLPTLLVQLEATALCPASYSRSVQRARKKAYVPLLEFNLIVRMVTKAFAALFVCIPAFACMMGGGVIGSGKEARETREVDNFTQLELLGVGRVEITIGDLRPLEIRGDDNILSMIETKVTDGRLIIRATRSIRPGQPLIIKATVSDLTAIMLVLARSLLPASPTTTSTRKWPEPAKLRSAGKPAVWR